MAAGKDDIVFISKGWTSAKKCPAAREGVALTWGVNAFADLEAAAEVSGETAGDRQYILTDAENRIGGTFGAYRYFASQYTDAFMPSVSDGDNYKFTAVIKPKNAIEISGAGTPELESFSVVGIVDSTVSVTGGYLSADEKKSVKTSVQPKTGTETVSSTYSGTIKSNAAGTLRAERSVLTVKSSAPSALYAEDAPGEFSAGNLPHPGASWAAVELTDCELSSDLTGGNNTNTVSGTKKIETPHGGSAFVSRQTDKTGSTSSASGRLTASGSALKNTTGYLSVTLDGGDFESLTGGIRSAASEITQARSGADEAKVSYTEKSSCSVSAAGSLTLFRLSAGPSAQTISGYRTVTLTGTSSEEKSAVAGTISGGNKSAVRTSERSFAAAVEGKSPETVRISEKDLDKWTAAGTLTVKYGVLKSAVSGYAAVVLNGGSSAEAAIGRTVDDPDSDGEFSGTRTTTRTVVTATRKNSPDYGPVTQTDSTAETASKGGTFTASTLVQAKTKKTEAVYAAVSVQDISGYKTVTLTGDSASGGVTVSGSVTQDMLADSSEKTVRIYDSYAAWETGTASAVHGIGAIRQTTASSVSFAAAGDISLSFASVSGSVSGYAAATLKNTEVTGGITGGKAAASCTDEELFRYLEENSRKAAGRISFSLTETRTEDTCGTLNMTDSTAGTVGGYRNMTLTGTAAGNVSIAGASACRESETVKYSQTYKDAAGDAPERISVSDTATVSAGAAGTFKAVYAVLGGDIAGWNTVTLTASAAGEPGQHADFRRCASLALDRAGKKETVSSVTTALKTAGNAVKGQVTETVRTTETASKGGVFTATSVVQAKKKIFGSMTVNGSITGYASVTLNGVETARVTVSGEIVQDMFVKSTETVTAVYENAEQYFSGEPTVRTTVSSSVSEASGTVTLNYADVSGAVSGYASAVLNGSTVGGIITAGKTVSSNGVETVSAKGTLTLKNSTIDGAENFLAVTVNAGSSVNGAVSAADTAKSVFTLNGGATLNGSVTGFRTNTLNKGSLLNGAVIALNGTVTVGAGAANTDAAEIRAKTLILVKNAAYTGTLTMTDHMDHTITLNAGSTLSAAGSILFGNGRDTLKIASGARLELGAGEMLAMQEGDSVVLSGGEIILSGGGSGIEAEAGAISGKGIIAMESEVFAAFDKNRISGAKGTSVKLFDIGSGDTALAYAGSVSEQADNTQAKAVSFTDFLEEHAAAGGGGNGWLCNLQDTDETTYLTDTADWIKFTQKDLDMEAAAGSELIRVRISGLNPNEVTVRNGSKDITDQAAVWDDGICTLDLSALKDNARLTYSVRLSLDPDEPETVKAYGISDILFA